MLDDRKKKVLQAIVEEYINTAEPVSSNALTKNHGLNCSSATIRNEMAELEKNGYLDKTHTSSGRVPSEKGYRYYVDELVNDKDISLEEIKYISDKLETKVNEIEDLTKITANTISEVTHYTTISIGPKTNSQLIEEIKFVLLGTRMMMAVILTDTGMVKETIIKFDEDITNKQVETINYMFNKKLKGQPLETIDRPLEDYLYDEMIYSINVVKPIIEQIKKVLADSDKMPVLVFDEIDTGISGKAANSVADKLKAISKKHQILCISHLPNIAAIADYNYFISKEVKEERTKTNIKLLKEEEVIKELARISSGEINEVTLKYAEKLRSKKAS